MFGFERLPFYLSVGLCAAGTCSLGNAQAADPSNLVVSVRTADLDLAAPAGAATLRHRVALAARDVCAWADPAKRMDFDPYADCVSSAVRAASPQVRTLLANAGAGKVMLAGAAPGQ